MKSLIKHILYTSLLAICLIIILGFIIPFIGRQLSIYEVTQVVILNKSFIILIGVILHFFCGFFMFKTKSFKDASFGTVIIVFLALYIGLTAALRILQGLSLTYFELELSLIGGLTLGYLMHKFNTILYRISILSLLAVLLLFTNYFTIPFANQKASYNNYNGESDMRKINNLVLYDGKGELQKINNQESKIIVIDFWNNTCAICFTKFPEFIKLQKRFLDNPNIEVIALNVFKEKKEIGEGEKLLEQTKNKDLVSYYISKDSISVFNVSSYPKVVVIKNNSISFEGNLETLLLNEEDFLY